MLRKVLAALAAAGMLAACSSQQGTQQGATSGSQASLRNPIDFPLYPGASLLSSRAFTQAINADTSPGGNSIFSSGNGTYTGNEVIAASDAAFSSLSAWVDHLAANPPPGYTSVESGANPQERVQAARYGLDYGVFTKKDGTRTRGLLVIVMDPRLVNQRFGTILGLISKYRALPDVMRAPIDNEAKARIGMTITQATQPDSPVGAALDALDQFEHKDSRGIVLIDASKR